MDWQELAINIFFTLVFGWLLIWTLFAWGIGMTNFQQKYNQLIGRISCLVWYSLIASHAVATYLLWTTSYSVMWLTLTLLTFHALFGFIFGKNVSAR